jgi:ABC-type oligopeptide transport system substrate-binding subunit
MLKNKKSILNSLMVVGLSIAAVGCGSKVAGTYSLSQTGNSYYTQCSAVSLNVTENSNAVTATGSNGTCIENLSGIDNGGTITVSSFTISLTNSYSNSMPQCSYTGTLTVNTYFY